MAAETLVTDLCHISILDWYIVFLLGFFTMAFCLNGKTMVMVAPVFSWDILMTRWERIIIAVVRVAENIFGCTLDAGHDAASKNLPQFVWIQNFAWIHKYLYLFLLSFTMNFWDSNYFGWRALSCIQYWQHFVCIQNQKLFLHAFFGVITIIAGP